MELEKF